MSFMNPTIKLGAKDPRMAVYGHILSLLGGVVAVVAGILGILNFFNALLGILTGLLIIAIEIDRVDIPFLKDALVRGIVWIVLAVAASSLGWWASILTGVGGILYLVYNFS